MVINMGFFIEVNRNALRKDKFFKFLEKLTIDVVNFLKKNKYLASDIFKIVLLDPETQEIFRESEHSWKEFRSEFSNYNKEFKEKKVCLQIISVLNLQNPDNGKEIPVNFDLFLNNNAYLYKFLGHFSFDLSGDSSDFPESDSSVDFDDFFIKQKGSNNRMFFNKLIQLFIDQNKDRNRIRRINVGERSMPFQKIHNAFYVYRSNIKAFEKDLLKDFDAIREEIEDRICFLEEDIEKLKEIWKEGFLSKIKTPALEDKIIYLNRENHFIEEYFKQQGVVQEGSFRFFNLKKYTYLYPPIEKFYREVTEILDEISSWDQIWDIFGRKWKERHQSIESKKMQ